MISEFDLIKEIAKLNRHQGGIGDDCAILPYNDVESLLVSTDMLIEDSHFIRAHISPYQLGYKTMAVNVSDIAAMGGEPLYAFFSWALPKNLDESWTSEFLKGLAFHNVPLMGGDTTGSRDQIALNITIIGKAETTKIKERSAAKVGDIICVTDFLGDSSAGLDSILNRRENQKLIERHYLPRPHLKEGQWLAKEEGVHAIMDVSDGISSDLKRICEESKCGASVDLKKIPLSEELKSYCNTYKEDPLSFATSGGEDYCLLVTIDQHQFQKIKESAPFQLFEIGKITKEGYDLQGGFDHFKT